MQCNSDYLGAKRNVFISTYMYIKSKVIIVNILNRDSMVKRGKKCSLVKMFELMNFQQPVCCLHFYPSKTAECFIPLLSHTMVAISNVLKLPDNHMYLALPKQQHV